MIRYSEKIDSTELLGPGERAVLWVHGCCFDCPGCIARSFRYGAYREATVEQLAEWILSISAPGITISGGEPLLQAAELARLLKMVREKREIGVIVYTGFVYESLLDRAAEEEGIRDFLSQIDLLIDGPYLEEQNNNDPFRGSSNQRILPLTERYKDQIESYYQQQRGRQIEVRLQGDKTLMVGIPSRDQAAIWQRIKGLGSNTPEGENRDA